MAKVFLNSFDIVAGANGGDGIRVAQIMEAGLWSAHGRYDPLEFAIHILRLQVTAQLIGEDVAGILPAFTITEAVFQLFLLDLAQCCDDERGQRDGAAFAVLGGHHAVLTFTAADILELFIDQERSCLQIDAVPEQTTDLTFPHSGEEGDDIKIFVGAIFDGLQEFLDLAFVQWLKILFDTLGQLAVIGGVKADVSIQDCFLKCFVKNAVNVFDGLGRKCAAEILSLIHI